MKNLRPKTLLCNGTTGLRATLAAEVRVIGEKEGLVEYIASDETIDSYREIIRVDGWRFDLFQKNAPFVDSHSYHSIEKQLGKVVDWKIDKRKRQLIETVQWAKDVEGNELARLGWAMTVGGYLKAVSVGFYPTRFASKWDSDRTTWLQQLQALGVEEETGVRVIYIEQQQIELSACIIGANPHALLQVSKAYKAGALTDAQMEMISRELSERDSDTSATVPGEADASRRQARTDEFLERLKRLAARF